MNATPDQFAHWLTQAVRLIKATEGKSIHIIQDELAMALGRGSGESSIGYWRKEHIPADLRELERLANLLADRGGLDRRSYEQFLRSAAHPQAETLAKRRFPGETKQPPAAIPTRPHPFNPNRPITDPRQFFGRERECHRILKWWARTPPQDVALIGPKKSGRTSLLYYLRAVHEVPPGQLRPIQREHRLPAAEQYRWVYVDYYDPRWHSPVRLLGYILAQLGFPIPDPLSLDTFMETMSERVRFPVILMLDDLGTGLELPAYDRHFWNTMRALATSATDNRLVFVITAAEDPQKLAAYYGKTSPFFNLFTTLRLGPLNYSAARELIAAAPLPFAPADVAWILEQSRLWPAALQALCRERLATLEEGDESDSWRAEAAAHLARYAHLLGSNASDRPAATG